MVKTDLNLLWACRGRSGRRRRSGGNQPQGLGLLQAVSGLGKSGMAGRLDHVTFADN